GECGNSEERLAARNHKRGSARLREDCHAQSNGVRTGPWMRNWTDSTYHNGPVSRTASESGQTDAFLRLRLSISPMRERSVLDCGLRVGQRTAASCRAAESVMLRAFFLAMGIS